MRTSLENYPEIADAWVLYDQCRSRTLERIEKQKGSGKSAVTEISLIPRTQGYGQLPWQGGILDQPHRLFVFFDAFQAGDAEAFADKVR